MKIKTLLLAVFAVILVSCPVHAAIINISIPNLNGDSTSVSGYSVTSSVVNTDDYLYTFTQTGNLDGGTVNDTFTFSFLVEGFTGSTSNGTDVTLGTTSAAVNQVGASNINFGVTNNDFDTGESLVFSLNSAVFTSGEGESATVTFNGFTSFFTAGSNSVRDWAIGTTNAQFFSLNRFQDPTFTASPTTLVVTSFTTNGVGTFRGLDSSFTVETVAVPEPGSAAILLGLLGMVSIRRRRK